MNIYKSFTLINIIAFVQDTYKGTARTVLVDHINDKYASSSRLMTKTCIVQSEEHFTVESVIDLGSLILYTFIYILYSVSHILNVVQPVQSYEILQLVNHCNTALNKENLHYNICWVDFSCTNISTSTKNLACANYKNIYSRLMLKIAQWICNSSISLFKAK